MTVLPRGSVDRLIRRVGQVRVSEKAAESMASVLEDIGLEIALIAKEVSVHAKRKTIHERDIELAFQQWRQKR